MYIGVFPELWLSWKKTKKLLFKPLTFHRYFSWNNTCIQTVVKCRKHILEHNAYENHHVLVTALYYIMRLIQNLWFRFSINI